MGFDYILRTALIARLIVALTGLAQIAAALSRVARPGLK